MSNKHRKPNATGRNNFEPFVKLTRNLLESEAWKHASPEARCIYIAIRQRYNGTNNGELALSCRDAAKVIQGSKNTASRKLNELMEKGLIKNCHKGVFRNRWASTWILTNENYNGLSPTGEWKQWRPENKTPYLSQDAKYPP